QESSTPTYGQSQTYGQESTPTYGQPGTPASDYGQPPSSSAQPGYGQPGYQQPGYGQQQPGHGQQQPMAAQSYGQQAAYPPPPGRGQMPPPPGGYPGGAYPASGYPAGMGTPPSYMAWAIIVTVIGALCCLFGCIPGIVSIVFAGQVNSKWTMGDVDGAMSASRNARIWAIVATVVEALALVGAIAWIIIAAATSHTTSSTYCMDCPLPWLTGLSTAVADWTVHCRG